MDLDTNCQKLLHKVVLKEPHPIYSNISSAANFGLECKTLNPTTNQVQVQFHPGDNILFRIVLDVPGKAVGKEVNAKFTLSFNMESLKIKFNLKSMELGFTNKDPEVEGITSLPFSGRIVKEKIVTIPAKIPNVKSDLTANVTIKGVGANKCKESIEVVK